MQVTGKVRVWESKTYKGSYSASLFYQKKDENGKDEGDPYRFYYAVSFAGCDPCDNGDTIEVKDGFFTVTQTKDRAKCGLKLVVKDYTVVNGQA